MTRPRQWTTDLRRLSRGAGAGTRALLLELQARGGWVGCNLGSGHIALRREGGRSTVVVSRSASDWRQIKNARSHVRREEEQEEGS